MLWIGRRTSGLATQGLLALPKVVGWRRWFSRVSRTEMAAWMEESCRKEKMQESSNPRSLPEIVSCRASERCGMYRRGMAEFALRSLSPRSPSSGSPPRTPPLRALGLPVSHLFRQQPSLPHRDRTLQGLRTVRSAIDAGPPSSQFAASRDGVENDIGGSAEVARGLSFVVNVVILGLIITFEETV